MRFIHSVDSANILKRIRDVRGSGAIITTESEVRRGCKEKG